MDALAAHARAQAAFGRVLAAVMPTQYGGPTPCEEWTVADLIDHVVGGNHRAAAAVMAGEVPAAAAQDTAASSPGRVVDLFRSSAERAEEAFAGPDALTRTIQWPVGPLPGAVLIGMRTTDVLVHAWDLAVATGQPTDLDPELSEACLATARERLQPSMRGPGRFFGPERQCPPGRSAADRLAAFMGRLVS